MENWENTSYSIVRIKGDVLCRSSQFNNETDKHCLVMYKKIQVETTGVLLIALKIIRRATNES